MVGAFLEDYATVEAEVTPINLPVLLFQWKDCSSIFMLVPTYLLQELNWLHVASKSPQQHTGTHGTAIVLEKL